MGTRGDTFPLLPSAPARAPLPQIGARPESANPGSPALINLSVVPSNPPLPAAGDAGARGRASGSRTGVLGEREPGTGTSGAPRGPRIPGLRPQPRAGSGALPCPGTRWAPARACPAASAARAASPAGGHKADGIVLG